MLEYRVSSLLFEESSRKNPLEVDSIVGYGMEDDRWALLTVQTERARNMNGRDSSASDESF